MHSRKIMIGLMFLCIVNILKAQSYNGFLTDNYSGVHSVISNPANIVDSRFKLDINLVGVSAFFGNDYFGLSLKDAFNDFSKTLDNAEKSPSQNNFLSSNLDVLGPSILFNIDYKNSIAFFTRGRAFFNVIDIDGSTLDKEGGFDESEDFSIQEGFLSGAANFWTEIGVSYARVLIDKEQHFLKGGLTIKYLKGFGTTYIRSKNLGIDYDSNTRTVATQGEFIYGNTGGLDDQGNGDGLFDSDENDGDNGFGADIGVVYEWRPDSARNTKMDNKGNTIIDKGANKYKLKFGVSVTDIGEIRNKNGVDQTYDLNRTQDIDNFDGASLGEALAQNFDLIGERIQSPNSKLPTALHTNADWNINSKFYLNLNADIPLTIKNNINTNRILNQVSLTPRFESAWLGFYSPFSVVQGAGFQWGAGFRAGPIYMGSGSIMSTLLGQKTKALDLYAGIKVPIYHYKLRDKDNDGIENRSDNCPDVAGPIENNGCPWKDTDGDGVLDKDDDCPAEVGPKENNGCPWKDTDGDGVLDKDDDCPQEVGTMQNKGCPDSDGDGIVDKDDRCPNIAGRIENKGCPDTDGDTLVDIDDSCPNTAGPISNNGCPEVTAEVQKQLNSYAKTILFDTGKSTIKSESLSVMVDIIRILTEYPNANFTVEGHTDSVGSATSNQRLSEARANSVRDFLIKEGITSNRLSAKGYGEDKPIATNANRNGRKQNRRVEINLMK